MRIANPFRRDDQGGGIPSPLLLVAAVGAAFLIVRLADVLLMVFASVLLAMLISAIAQPLQTRARLGRSVALATVLVLLLAIAAALLWLFGAQMADQIANLKVLLPRSWRAFEGQMAQTDVGRLVLNQVRSAKWPDNVLLTLAARFVGNVASALVFGVVTFAGAIYLAFHPETYGGGLLRLIPGPSRKRAAEVMDACRRALTQWLVGQTLSMIFVAALTSVGLWLAGVPSPFALGLLAGLGHAVPVVGPWVTASPGLLIAAAQGPQTFVIVFLIYLVVSQIEANVLMPLILRRMSEVPMAVTLFAVIAMGVLFGSLGVLLATPLAVLAYVLVRTVYVEDVLGERSGPDPAEPPRSRIA
jgi:predicted PurR-regulated permease PerM